MSKVGDLARAVVLGPGPRVGVELFSFNLYFSGVRPPGSDARYRTGLSCVESSSHRQRNFSGPGKQPERQSNVNRSFTSNVVTRLPRPDPPNLRIGVKHDDARSRTGPVPSADPRGFPPFGTAGRGAAPELQGGYKRRTRVSGCQARGRRYAYGTGTRILYGRCVCTATVRRRRRDAT